MIIRKRLFHTLFCLTATAFVAACARDEAPVSTATEAQPADAQVVSELQPLSEAAARVITPDYLREMTVELSDDRYGGRAPGTDGDRLARAFLANALADIGFEPGGDDGSYEQRFSLVGMRTHMPETWRFATRELALDLQRSTDFIVTSGQQADSVTLQDAELVFVGYGITAPEYAWDDYKGMDLDGKVLVMLNNDPDWDDALFAGNTRLYYGRWSYKYEEAARQGAAGAIIIHTQPSAGYLWQVVQTSWGGEQFELPAIDGEPRLQVRGWITEDAARRTLELAGFDLAQLVEQARSADFTPVPLGLTTSIELDVDMQLTETANVIGVLPGSDPVLREQAVVLTAHHDHLGMLDPADAIDGDTIYNGALDNAAGVALMLAVGRAYTELDLQPRRSLVINFVGAEEQGLLGSLHYAQNPTFPAARIAANVNVDGPGIWGETRDLTYIGYGKSDLDAIVEEVAALQGRTVVPDQFPDRGSFYRSDQFSFARVGIPSTYLDSGTDVIGQPAGWGEEQINRYTDLHYHQPSDEVTDEWNFDGVVQDALLNLLVSWRIANNDAMPKWNAGDEFAGLREGANP
ncbi:MAG: M28 family metallopeptidase [Pseudomonadota bacterium]|nr:M28 family metallopeptidase [Pseudomonadota bacterium]